MGPFGSNITTDNFVPQGVPVIRGLNLNGERFKDEKFVFLTDDKADELHSANAFPDDLVFTHRGTLGQVGIIPKNARYPRYVVSQSQMKLSCDNTKVDPLFVFYYFRSNRGQHALLANTSTTGVPAISRPLTSLKAIRIPFPPLAEQCAIAHILGTLDDKIELNRRMNETLEAMARAIFKSWFVDFDPVRAKAEGRQPDGLDADTAALFS
jgi:type I restriction enzyme S subunit